MGIAVGSRGEVPGWKVMWKRQRNNNNSNDNDDDDNNNWILEREVFKYLPLNSCARARTHAHAHLHILFAQYNSYFTNFQRRQTTYTTQCLQADPSRTERRSSGFTFPNKTKGPWISVRDKIFYDKDYAQYLTSNPYNPMDKELSCLHYTLTLTAK